MGTRYSPSQYPPDPHTPGTPPTTVPVHVRAPHTTATELNMAVGLKSVRQLTLSVQISGIQGITEIYNLATARNPNDHKLIPGFD